LNENQREHLFFHSSLADRKEPFVQGQDDIQLVVECVITKMSKDKKELPEFFSGGYFTINPFLPVDKPALKNFIRGSPRDLLMNMDGNQAQERTSMSLMIREYPAYSKVAS